MERYGEGTNILALKQDRFNEPYIKVTDLKTVSETGLEIGGYPHSAMAFILPARDNTPDSQAVVVSNIPITLIDPDRRNRRFAGFAFGDRSAYSLKSIVHLSVAFWPFPPHDDGPLCNRKKSEAATEPTLFHRIVQSITRRLRMGTPLVGSVEGHPKIAVYGSQRMCRSCGAITARSNPFCLECGALLPAV